MNFWNVGLFPSNSRPNSISLSIQPRPRNHVRNHFRDRHPWSPFGGELCTADRCRGGRTHLEQVERLRALHAIHVSSTFYGGGVTEILTPLTLMMNALGIETGWRLIQGTPEFFGYTKKLHNALQGGTIDLTDEERAGYEQVTFENAMRLHIEDCDAVIVHDPQPLPLVAQLRAADTSRRSKGSASSTAAVSARH